MSSNNLVSVFDQNHIKRMIQALKLRFKKKISLKDLPLISSFMGEAYDCFQFESQYKVKKIKLLFTTTLQKVIENSSLESASIVKKSLNRKKFSNSDALALIETSKDLNELFLQEKNHILSSQRSKKAICKLPKASKGRKIKQKISSLEISKGKTDSGQIDDEEDEEEKESEKSQAPKNTEQEELLTSNHDSDQEEQKRPQPRYTAKQAITLLARNIPGFNPAMHVGVLYCREIFEKMTGLKVFRE